MDETMNFLDAINADEQTAALGGLINQIMEINDGDLTDDTLEVYDSVVNNAFGPNIIRKLIQNLHNEWDEAGYNNRQVREMIEELERQFNSIIEMLQPSEKKLHLLNTLFISFKKIFEQAAESYHTYAFELPIKLESGGQMPTYAHDTDACADLYAAEDVTIPAHSLSNKVSTGLRIALPEGWVAKIVPRSSTGAKTGLRLPNSVGVIDADYRGIIMLLFDNLSDSDYEIKAGDRLAQMWIEPVYRFKPVVVDILPETERGDGGFGSTGK